MPKISSLYFILCTEEIETETLNTIATRLHPAVQERIRRYKTAERRNQTILGRALLAIALTELGEAPDVLLTLGTQIDGSPVLPAGYHCSISHTNGLVGAVATCGMPIGLDVEQRQYPYAPFAHTFASDRCDHYPASCDCLARVWVAKEAAAKAAMAPLQEALGAPYRLGRVYLRGQWLVSHLELTRSIIGSVATPPHCPIPTVSWLSGTQLLAYLRSSHFFR